MAAVTQAFPPPNFGQPHYLQTNPPGPHTVFTFTCTQGSVPRFVFPTFPASAPRFSLPAPTTANQGSVAERTRKPGLKKYSGTLKPGIAKGTICVDYVNEVPCTTNPCCHTHASQFNTKFSFNNVVYTIDLHEMLQISHETMVARNIEQRADAQWWYEEDNGRYAPYSLADSEAISSKLSRAHARIVPSPLMHPMSIPEPEMIGNAQFTMSLPAHWKPRSSPSLVVDMVLLDRNSHEFHSVQRAFVSTGNVKVNSIVRVQNYGLMMQYLLRRYQKRNHGGKEIQEKMLFHGARQKSNLQRILSNGFDTNVSAMSGLCGAGTYFATTSQYSKAYAVGYEDGSKSMLLCRVQTGKPEARNRHGSGTIRKPSEGYDSVVDKLPSPSMYVVYYNSEAVPEYLVNYTTCD